MQLLETVLVVIVQVPVCKKFKQAFETSTSLNVVDNSFILTSLYLWRNA